MTINFHDENNKQSYTTRAADAGWLALLGKIIDPASIGHAADIGCGGGIYTKALADLKIPAVTGVDFSEAMIDAAKTNCGDYHQLNFQVGNALETGLSSGKPDLILERALIHHLQDLEACFTEAYRVLNHGGTFITQDRTPVDCLLEGTSIHIRGYILSKFPRLKTIETQRRHESETVSRELGAVGFSKIKEIKLWETKQVYSSKKELLDDIRSRTGRSILHELDNRELKELVDYMDGKLDEKEIIEKDRWTIWKAT